MPLYGHVIRLEADNMKPKDQVDAALVGVTTVIGLGLGVWDAAGDSERLYTSINQEVVNEDIVESRKK